MKFEFKIGRIVEQYNIPATPETDSYDKTGERTIKVGNSFQVRIIPEMEGIFEADLLPYYPNFITGIETAYTAGEKVWCLTNEDFTVGFILGRAQPPKGSDIQGPLSMINKAEAGLYYSSDPLNPSNSVVKFPSTSSFNEITITRFSGTSFSFTNEKLGHSGTWYKSNCLMMYGADGSFWMQTPNMTQVIDAMGNSNMVMSGSNNVTSLNETTVTSGESREKVGSKYIDSDSNITLNSGGAVAVAGSSITESVTGNKESLVTGTYKQTLGTDNKVVADLTNASTHTYASGMTLNSPLLNIRSATVSISGGSVTITGPVTVLGPVTMPGAVGLAAPTGSGGFCALPVCLFAGVPHIGTVLA